MFVFGLVVVLLVVFAVLALVGVAAAAWLATRGRRDD
jgi:hypothetical protein